MKNNTTLLREVQILLERTYGKTGLDIRRFLLDRRRDKELSEIAGMTIVENSDLGRTHFSIRNGRLHMGIYYGPGVVKTLEKHNPQHIIDDENILVFMILIEELDHAIHTILKFREGERGIYREEFTRNLELQAKVDVYRVLRKFCLMSNNTKELTAETRRWLMACVFDSENLVIGDTLAKEQYRESRSLARRYVAYLETLDPVAVRKHLRRFRPLSYRCKKGYILAVTCLM